VELPSVDEASNETISNSAAGRVWRAQLKQELR
jgi:hypothetical protein